MPMLRQATASDVELAPGRAPSAHAAFAGARTRVDFVWLREADERAAVMACRKRWLRGLERATAKARTLVSRSPPRSWSSLPEGADPSHWPARRRSATDPRRSLRLSWPQRSGMAPDWWDLVSGRHHAVSLTPGGPLCERCHARGRYRACAAASAAREARGSTRGSGHRCGIGAWRAKPCPALCCWAAMALRGARWRLRVRP
jgi:hypothetical protein